MQDLFLDCISFFLKLYFGTKLFCSVFSARQVYNSDLCHCHLCNMAAFRGVGKIMKALEEEWDVLDITFGKGARC